MLSGCAGDHLDPAGEARSQNPITDAQVASLQEPIRLEELKRIWGPGEGQPGPRITYKSADHAGQYFWVYYSRSEKDPTSDIWVIERILRADRIEEGSVIVWPARLQKENNRRTTRHAPTGHKLLNHFSTFFSVSPVGGQLTFVKNDSICRYNYSASLISNNLLLFRSSFFRCAQSNFKGEIVFC